MRAPPVGGGVEIVEAPVGLLGLFTHSSRARDASSGEIAARSRRPSGRDGTGTARQRASSAPIAYEGYDTAGYSTVSRVGVRKLIHCGSVTTNSLVPTVAPMSAAGTSTANRRCIHRWAASRSATDPMLGGYDRSEPLVASASRTDCGGGSHGVPIERSTTPPSCADAIGTSESRRSYG